MLVLLPPSEGKADGHSGPPVDMGALSLPGLAQARESVLAELTGLCAADPHKAREVLGLSERQLGEVTKNAALRTAPARPAAEIYTGVLYDALGLGSLSAAAKERAARSVLVFSGLWGALRVTDPIPSYRCSSGVRLPGLGALGAYWRASLAEVLPPVAGDGLVLDLRSAAYATMWRPGGQLAERTVTVRVLRSVVTGSVEKRSVVSHFNKATKGRLARELLESGALPASPTGLRTELRRLGYQVEGESPAPGKAWRFDVIVTEV